MGGLIWGAEQLPDGTIQNHGHLSLDQYEENQVFALDAGQEGKDAFSRISILDQGDYPIEEKRRVWDTTQLLPPSERDAAWKAFWATHRHDVKRLVLGRSPDGSVGLNLRDGAGRVRLRLTVDSGGKPAIEVLDEAGNVLKDLANGTAPRG